MKQFRNLHVYLFKMKVIWLSILSHSIATQSTILHTGMSAPISFAGELYAFDTCSLPLLNKTVEGGCQSRITDYNGNSIIEIYRRDERVCPTGVILPLFPSENMWSRPFRSIVYFVFLSYLFLGIAIASDVFMGAIEVITSQEKIVKYKDEHGRIREKSVVIWNETVANLTLMALGSSAPEIILATWEGVIRLGQPPRADGLGVGTIVGSAAYNLLMIIALCIYVIPNGESRRIKAFRVFVITMIFSLLAYVWLYLVLVVITPGVVDLVEALITLGLFPVLIGVSYLFDIKAFSGSTEFPATRYMKESATLTRKLLTKMVKKRSRSPTNSSAQEIAHDVSQTTYPGPRKSSLFYRISALRSLKSGQRMVGRYDSEAPEPFMDLSSGAFELNSVTGQELALVSFSSSEYGVSDLNSSVMIHVTRSKVLNTTVTVDYETGNGTAKSGAHYAYTSGTIEFAPNETNAVIHIPILGSTKGNVHNCDFKIRLLNCSSNAILPDSPEAIVNIVDHCAVGYFVFEKSQVEVREDAGTLELAVIRKEGCKGNAKLKWTATNEHLRIHERLKAMPGVDFTPDSGTIEFAEGELKKFIRIEIVDDDQFEENERFEVKLVPDEDFVDSIAVGDKDTCVVTIIDNDEITTMVDRVAYVLNLNLDKIRTSGDTWRQQFANAMVIEGENGKEPTKLDSFMHAISFHWKILFAIIPPTKFLGGWLAFWTSLLFIGALTAVVADAASIFGCALGLPEEVIAITFVALGTSIPDTFASIIAAKQDEYADASIVNVTGSNSVNVFFGLGLPWTISAIYYALKGEAYIVPAGTLGYSVGVFCIIAIIVVAILIIRRSPKVANGELGGPTALKIGTSLTFFALWILYIVLSSVNSITAKQSP
jgi:solute carrier family 8 (sodium/calcium exchanger)